MTSERTAAYIKPAIRVAAAGLGGAVGGPLGGALGAWLGDLLGHSASELIGNYAEEFGKEAGKKLFDATSDTLIEQLKREGPDLEGVYRETLRVSLSSIRDSSVTGFEDWFSHWDLALTTPGRLDLSPIQQDDFDQDKLDQLLRITLEDLDAQGKQISLKGLSIKQQRRTMPDSLFSLVQLRLPALLQESFRLLIVKPKYEQAWKQSQTAFDAVARASLQRIEEAAREIERKTKVLPQVSDDVAATRADVSELRRILQQSKESPAANPPDSGAWDDFYETVLSQGGVIYEDPWDVWKTETEREFKELMKGRTDKQFDLWRNEAWPKIIALWEPLQSNEYFNIEHPYWRDKPYFRCLVHLANSGLFVAHAQITTKGEDDYVMHYREAIRYLNEVLREHPYAMLGAASDRLSVDMARAQNENFLTTLSIAKEFLRGWGGSVLFMININQKEGELLEKTVQIRLNELQWVLDRHPAKQ